MADYVINVLILSQEIIFLLLLNSQLRILNDGLCHECLDFKPGNKFCC